MLLTDDSLILFFKNKQSEEEKYIFFSFSSLDKKEFNLLNRFFPSYKKTNNSMRKEVNNTIHTQMLKLESLPNEILLELFYYIDGIQLIQVFSKLNIRFHNLLFNSFQQYSFNFQSVFKKDLDLMCRKYFPKLFHRIISLTLSNDLKTPYAIEQFFSYSFRLNSFTQLKSLSLYCMDSDELFEKILIDLPSLQHLTHFKLVDVEPKYSCREQFVHIIWNLPKLIYLSLPSHTWYLGNCFEDELTFCSSLKYLSTLSNEFNIKSTINLFICTPNLENLSIRICDGYNFDHTLTDLLPSLEILTINIDCTVPELKYILDNTPNLIYLKISSNSLKMNGYVWEDIFCNYLLKLKIFHLQIHNSIIANDNIVDIADELINTFRTSFWLDERQIYVRCIWEPEDKLFPGYRNILLYTLPYVFDEFNHISTFYTKTTYPNETDYWTFDHIHSLFINPCDHNKKIPNYPICFPKLYRLNFFNAPEPIDKYPLIFDQLYKLEIFRIHPEIRSNLQILLNRSTRLDTIIFNTTDWLLFFLKIPSVRHIRIHTGDYYNARECGHLCKSTLFQQCEILRIGIKTRGSVLDFIRKLSNLRVLSFACENDPYRNTCNSISTKQDELVKWLKRYLPRDCLIERENQNDILLWIR